MAYSSLTDSYAAGLVSRCHGPFQLLAGPPGSGKSWAGRALVREYNIRSPLTRPVRFWSFNLSCFNPIEARFILIPDGKGGIIRKLAPHFELPQEGDVVEWTEFGRSHPQVQASMMDVWASGEVDGFELPWVYNYATSNDRLFRSSAMKDRFMVSISPDPRKISSEAKVIKRLITDQVGLEPTMISSNMLDIIVERVIGPTYDGFGPTDPGSEVPAVEFKGLSTRNVIGRIQQRDLGTDSYGKMIQQLVVANNERALENKAEHYIVMPGTKVAPAYLKQFLDLESRADSFAQPVRNTLRLNRVYIERSLA